MAFAFISKSVASKIINNFVDTCSSYLKAFPAANDMQDELDRLQDALPQVQAVLTAVEDGAPNMVENEGLRRWLWQLRDAVENAENVLNELDYYELEKRIQDRDDKVCGILSKYKRKYDSFVNCISSNDILKRLREVVKMLDKVIARMEPLLQIVTGFYGHDVKRRKVEEVKNSRKTRHLLTENVVLGRDEERELIVEWLIKSADGESEGTITNVSAFAIVGMGGLGKTTLAQLIYDDERVKQYFHLIMWVCVSQDFDAEAISRKMLESKTLEGNSNGSLGDKSLNALHEYLKQKLTSKRFLLILDDVWNDDNMMKWENLVAPLKFGQRGSKILLTTRMASVVDMVSRVMQCKKESLNLNELEENDYMSLFNKHAFFDVNPDDHKNLQPIGKQIAKKLGGCPLAIKVMGGLLNSNLDYDFWERFLKEDTMKLQQGKSDIMTILRLSYDHLPIHLQVCFRYCSIFQQDHIFNRKELVEMWIGSGLIPQSIFERQRSCPEDIGKEYFDLLTRISFFTYKTNFYRHKFSKYYVMHDLLHDLAQSVSREECIRIRGDVAGNIIPETVRHLSFENINLLSIRAISKLKNLHTLIISAEENYKHNADYLLVFNEVIKGFKNLRLLSLRVDFYLYKLPDKLGSLVHLRYLSLTMQNMNENFLDFFHSTLCRLYHLEFLKFNITGETSDIIEFDGLANLVSLRSFVPSDVTKKIPFVGKLTSIRKLEDFFVQEKSGYKISELNDLRELRRLSITGLENVRTSEEAMEAKLKDKNYLKSLSLQWSEDRSKSAEAAENLLDNLCPHTNIKKLDIREYQGVKSPCWMTNLSLVNLTSIVLMGCKGWEHLPPLGRLQSLNTLHMTGMHAVKQIGGGGAFPSLKNLVFEDMPNLEEWIGIDDCYMFPKLHTLQIIWCPNLRGLPALPRCLNQLCINDVGLTALPAINEDCRNNNQQKQFSDLETTLIIEDCEKLQYLRTEFFHKFNTIKVLTIRNCPKLEEWIGIDDGCMFPKLHTMRINDCPNLRGIPTLPRSLKHLSIFNVGLRDLHISNVRLTALPTINEDCGNNNQEQFLALEILTIERCEKLQYLPTELFHKFNTLKVLRIENCPKWTIRGISNIQQPSILNERTIGSCGDLEVLLLCSANLTYLTISGLHAVKKIDSSFFGSSRGCAFPSLEDLYFKDLPNLEEWIGIDDCCMFPKLRTMQISRCPNLRGLPTLPCSLTDSYISNVGLTALPAIDENCGNNIQQERFPALKTLTIERCEKLQYLPTEFLKKFNTIKVSGLHAVKTIEFSLFGSREWIGIDDCYIFPELRTMEIINCPNLRGLPTLPCSLRDLHISNVGLTALPAIDENCGNNNQQEHFRALKKLTIAQCDKLEYIPIEIFQKFNTVKFLRITNCSKLTTRGISDIRILDKLTIESCDDLEVHLLLLLPNLTSLPRLELVDCASITSLPPTQVCARWTMLSDLGIKNCKELSSFGGIQALVSLRWLEIIGCDKLIEVALRQPPFPNDVGQKNAADCFLKLGKLSIDHHALLLMEPLRSLSSISSFTLYDASGLTSLPEEWLLQNHSALKELRIWNAVSLQSLPQSMTKLCSLQSLDVSNAKLIQSLPDLPTSLCDLCITVCHPELKERCQENIGIDWPKIANIRRVEIELANILKRTTQRFLHRTSN